MTTTFFDVAEHRFAVSGEERILVMMDNYKPFVTTAGDTVFSLTAEAGTAPDYSEELRQEEEGQDIICGKTPEGCPVFEFRWWNETAGWLVCAADYSEGRLVMTGSCEKLAIDNALMVL